MESLGFMLKRRLFGIPEDEIRASRRGFQVTRDSKRERIEQIGTVFLGGYHWAVFESYATLVDRLRRMEPELSGFANEGAAMGLALMDAMPWGSSSRFSTFLQGPGADHVYMLHVGCGWLLGRLPWIDPSKLRRSLDPLLGWMAIDGYGFHEGFFHPYRTLMEKRYPRRLDQHERMVFDQGLGRSLWFSQGADVDRVSGRIHSFALERQSDLWSGVGLAAVYAGGVDEEELYRLKELSCNDYPSLAQGASFAAKARIRAGNETVHTRKACEILCGMDAEEAALITDRALPEPGGSVIHGNPFQDWRRAIQHRFVVEKVRMN